MNAIQLAAVFNWRNQTNKSGLYSIHLRVTIDRDSRYYKIPLPKKVSSSEWGGKEGNWVRNIHPFAFEINGKILEIQGIINDLIRRHYNMNKPLSFEVIDRQLKKKGNANSFLEFMKNYIADPPEKLEPNTLKKYNTCMIHLKTFRTPVYFSDVDGLFIKDFYKYMHKDLGLEGSSIKKYMDSLKKVIKAARRENYISSSQVEFMFEDVKIQVKKSTRRVFLDTEEIKRWMAVKFPEGKEYLERDRDIYLYQIYTGYYYKDLRIFRKNQLMNDKEYGYIILGERDKNGYDTIIPLFKFENAVIIMKKYGSGDTSPLVFKDDIFLEEPAYNRNLKEIAKLAGIQKNVTNKVARHSNAQLYIRYGAKTPVVSKMLGHTKEETTKHYYDVNIPEIVEGTKGIDFKKLGI